MKVIRTQWSTAFILSALEKLFSVQQQGLKDDADRYVSEAKRYLGLECNAIFAEGHRYTLKNMPRGKRVFHHVPEEMAEKFHFLVKKEERLEADYQVCKQTLSIRLKHCGNYQAFRDYSPDCIVDCFPKEISSLSRSIVEPPIPDGIVQGMELIEYYSALRLIV